jgi:hypothetical protein
MKTTGGLAASQKQLSIDTLKRQFAISQDESVLKVLRDELVARVPEGIVDSKKWVDEQVGIVQVRWHSLTSLKATAKRHLREDSGPVVNSFVLARIKATQKYTDVFAGDVVLVSPMVEPNENGPTTRRYFRQYRVAFAPTADFEILTDEVAQDQPKAQPPMKIELKKFTANQKFSEETLMFRAEVWINGTRAGNVENDGRGGSTNVHYSDPATDDRGLSMGERVREYLHSLPPDIGTLDAHGHPVSETGNVPQAYDLTEDYFFGMLAEAAMKAKDDARIQKWLVKQAEKIRAAGMQPRKFVVRKRNGTESVTVVPFPNEPSAKAIEAETQRLSRGGATVVSVEAL